MLPCLNPSRAATTRIRRGPGVSVTVLKDCHARHSGLISPYHSQDSTIAPDHHVCLVVPYPVWIAEVSDKIIDNDLE
jgi:hypothetical protein